MELMGWIGSFLFAICGLPQAWQSYKQGHSNGLNWFFILAWFYGEILTLGYIWPKQDWPLICNYLINILFILIIIKYKVYPRE